MAVSAKLDRGIASFIALGILLGAAITGKIATGIEYCFVMFVVLGICVVLRAKPLFLTGVSLGLSAALLAIIYGELFSFANNGFGVMLFYISVGAGLLTTVFFGFLSRADHFSKFGATGYLLIGLAGMFIGFWGVLLIQCNTSASCGQLSLLLK
jgi:hypothetical protein